MSQKLVLMSGVCGSGKSTWAKTNYPNAKICSVDDYYLDIYGAYKYDRSRLSEVHQKCYNQIKKYLISKEPIVVIDNCNISRISRVTYMSLAKTFNYEVDLVVLKVDPQIAYQRCIHNVSLSAIKAMDIQLKSLNDKKVIDNT